MGRRKRSGGGDREGATAWTWDRKPSSSEWAAGDWNDGQQWQWSIRTSLVDENEDPVLKTSNEPNEGKRQTHCKAELRSVVQGNARLQKQYNDEKTRADALKAEVKASMATIRSLQQSHQSMEKMIADLQAENGRLRQQVGTLTDKVTDVESDKEALWKSYFAFRYFQRFKLAAKGTSTPTKNERPKSSCGAIGGSTWGKQSGQSCAPMQYTTLDEEGKRPDQIEPCFL
jgi:hypothetical protein